MRDVGGTCEYVLDRDDPSTWGGEQGDACYVAEDVLTDAGRWRCPHERAEGSDRCLFHQPVDQTDDDAVVKAFLDKLHTAADSPEGDATDELQFLGARFGTFDLSNHDTDAIGSLPRIDLSHTTFTGEVNLKNRSLDTPELSFRGSHFQADAVFSGLSVTGELLCRSCVFDDYTSFGGAVVGNEAVFNGANFARTATFMDATFEGPVDLDTARFDGTTSFSGATVDGELSSKTAEFNGRFNLDTATLNAPVSFLQTTFNDQVSCESTVFGDELSFFAVNFDQYADFESATFAADADFRKAEFRDVAHFESATFRERASFEEVAFLDDAAFESVDFEGFAAFWSTFDNDANYQSAQFDEYTTFEEASIAGHANFESTVYDAIVRFPDAEFDGDATFDSSEFHDLADFEEASFTQSAGFASASFDDTARFTGAIFDGSTAFGSVVVSDAQFRNVTFADETTFEQATLSDGGTFSNAQFVGPATFRAAEAHDDISFEDVGFEAPADFAEAELPEASFVGSDICEANVQEATLDRADFENADLTGANLERATLSNADLYEADLSGTHLYGTRLDGAAINTETVFDRHGDYRCVYDPGSTYPYDADDEEKVGRIRKAMGAYHVLEQVTRTNTLPDEQSKFFARRQDMRRAQLRQEGQHLQYSFAVAQNAVFRHGESFSRVLAWAVGTIVAFAILYPAGGFLESDPTGPITYSSIAESPALLWKVFYHSTLLFFTGGGPLSPTGLIAEALVTLEVVTAPVLLALLVFVLGRRAAR